MSERLAPPETMAMMAMLDDVSRARDEYKADLTSLLVSEAKPGTLMWHRLCDERVIDQFRQLRLQHRFPGLCRS